MRDARFTQALDATAPDLVRRWSANAVRVLDEHGRVVEAAPPRRDAHWVAIPAMHRLPQRWAEPLQAASALHLGTRVTHIARDALVPARWQLHTQGLEGDQRVHAGFDRVILAVPASQARSLL